MKQFLPLLLVCIAALGACRKRPAPMPTPEPESAAPAGPETPSSPAAPAPVQAPTAPAGAKSGNYLPGTTDLDDLSRHLAWFVVSKNRFPADVNELLTANRLPKPVLPPGGQLVINKKTTTVDYVGPK